MKHSLLKLLLIFILMVVSYGADFTHNFTLSKSDPYLKEPVILTLDIAQTDTSKVLLFKFDIKQNDAYEFHRLDIKTSDAYHAIKVHYKYLIYPLKEGKIDINFDLIEMVTTDDKVAYSFSGDRDNTRGLNKTDIPITLPPLSLQVQSIPKDTQIVGDFTLSHSIKQLTALSYEPLPLTLTLKGDGYPPIVTEIIPKSPHYSIFSESPIVKSIKHNQGSTNSVTYPLALSAKESFSLESISIKAFNPKNKKSYNLTLPKQNFTITQPDVKTLIDSSDYPKPLESDWSWLVSLLSYIIVFIAGVLSAKSISWHRDRHPQKEFNAFGREIKKCKNPKELLSLLMADNSLKYRDEIERLEALIYSKKRDNIESIKKSIYAQIDNLEKEI